MAAPIRTAFASMLLLLAAATVRAQPIPTMRLLQPSDLYQVSSSPSGTRVAGLEIYRGEVVLLVAQWQDGQLRPVISTYYSLAPKTFVDMRFGLGRVRSIIGYRWLNDDYLLLQVEDVVDGWQIPVVAGVADSAWRPLPMFTQLIKYPWGDGDQALLQESSGACRSLVASFCLFSLNLNHWGGDLLTPPVQLLPVDFLAVSPAEIYASGRKILGRNVLGPHEEYRLGEYQRWHRVPDGTLAQRRASQQEAQQPAASLMAAAAQVGINHPTFVFAPGRRVVGVIGRAPEAAFVALDPKLEGVHAWLANNYPMARVSISGLNATLTQGQVTVWDADLPPTTFFLGPGGEPTRFEAATPRAQPSRLGRTHREPDWAAGAAVAVTLPPAGVALRGAVVTPVAAAAKVLEDPLDSYRADVQAFAQQGIAVIRLLAPIPDSFASNTEGSTWRAALDAHLQQVVDHASSELLQGKPVCLYGEGLAGELALATGGLSHVGCIAAVNAALNASELSKLLLEGVPRGYAGLEFRIVGPTQQMLDRDFPAAFGNPQNQLNNSVSWVAGLPDSLMLGYDTARYADAARGYSTGDFAAGSGAFRSAARAAGKHVDFYQPNPQFYTLMQRQARMIDTVTRYVDDYYATGAASRQ